MKKEMAIVTRKEKEEIEKLMLNTYSSRQELGREVEVDTLSLILYKLHLLEEKIDRIEHNTENHWASSKVSTPH